MVGAEDITASYVIMATNPFLDAATADAGQSKSSPAPTESKWFNFKPVNPFTFSFTGASKDGNAELPVEEDDGDMEKGKSPVKTAKETAKERELKKREEELAKREALLQEQQRQNLPRIPNFPFFWPVMYHNINFDIPAPSRVTMRWIFRNWLFMLLTMLVNSAGCFSIMTAHVSGNTTGARDFGVSIMYFLVIGIASFYLWYRPVYNGFKKDSSMLFYFFFFFGGWHILFVFYMALGIPSSGSSGIINTISVVTDNKIVSGILCSVSSSMWLVHGLVQLYLYKRTHYYYRVKGLTVDDARNEAVKSVAGSGVMQGVAGGYMKSNTGFF
ncbi:scamp family-domain-containing protein [Chytridium lagenaria]|nr:scamp family-domain-containing protein [Chytridium lagenaria]